MRRLRAPPAYGGENSDPALDRTLPILPMLPEAPERASHDYIRHGTSSLYAVLDIASGKGHRLAHSRHRAAEINAFLRKTDAEVPAVHLVTDNASTHKTPAVKRWLTTHPRFVVHFTPTSASWMNLVERLFAELTTKKLQRSTHTSVRQLNSDIRTWITTWNGQPATLRLGRDRRPDSRIHRTLLERIKDAGQYPRPFSPVMCWLDEKANRPTTSNADH